MLTRPTRLLPFGHALAFIIPLKRGTRDPYRKRDALIQLEILKSLKRDVSYA